MSSKKIFSLRFFIDNAAFDHNGEYEAARILKEVAEKLENGTPVNKIRDINGNTIGGVVIERHEVEL